MDIMWPAVIIGMVAIVIGIVAIKARKNLTSAIAEGQRASFGRFGETVARQARPSGVVVAGVFFIIIGIAGIVMGLLIPPVAW